MNSYFKAVIHTILTILALYIGGSTGHTAWLDISIGTGLSLVLNWLASHFVPTTTGASAHQ